MLIRLSLSSPLSPDCTALLCPAARLSSSASATSSSGSLMIHSKDMKHRGCREEIFSELIINTRKYYIVLLSSFIYYTIKTNRKWHGLVVLNLKKKKIDNTIQTHFISYVCLSCVCLTEEKKEGRKEGVSCKSNQVCVYCPFVSSQHNRRRRCWTDVCVSQVGW